MQHYSYYKTLLLLISILSSFQILQAQERIKITVANAEDHEPIPFATIAFPKMQYGFSTNGNGQFLLPQETSYLHQTLSVSNIGFESFEDKVENIIKQKTDTIFLNPKTTMLSEIVVLAEKEDPKDIVNSVEKGLDDFLRKDSYYLYGFYKETIKVNSDYEGYTEAYGVFLISGYNPSYNRKNSIFSYDIAQWKNMRRSQYQLPSECNSQRKRTLEIDKLSRAKSEYLYDGPFNKKNKNKFRYTIDSLTVYDNSDVLVIGFSSLSSQKHSYSGQAFIKADDFALLRIEIKDQDASDILYESCKISRVATDFSLDFIKIDNKYYLKQADLNTSYYLNTDTLKESIQLQGGEFRDNKAPDLNYDQREILYNEMINPLISYEPTFWQVQQRPIAEKVKEDLSKEDNPLKKQFMFNNGRRVIPLPNDYTSYEQMHKEDNIFQMFLNSNY
ncbi:carboxypeptidase-like regulatory domain-containing protein [Fulvivirga sediminis]|uniref:Carboxypeptidase-like regulatory domain-containing protein n=1 Tax=Fulvivirga sediminis TaxID=2803949 RepID=A0A937K0Y6_9BACT|nr:carboxypeptidase-like regulatory domain-containing protein [Fulvivirga sediminis]MBL3658074.1 carboxypeptidase-like regulatory domain-containing protein [Fulvivirga sediminis]